MNSMAKFARSARRETGAVLVMAMVVLLIVTIIGVSALNISALEEKMAGNIQDGVRAFEHAETGLNKALNTAGAFDLFEKKTSTFPLTGGSAVVETQFTTYSPPKRGSGYSVINYDSANFDQKSLGKGVMGGVSVVHQGASQIVNKSQ